MGDIFTKIDEHNKQHRMSHWEGTFRDYLSLVIENPQLAQLAHARVYDMVRSFGVEVDEQGNERFQFFSRELFGIDEALTRIVEYLKAAAMGSDVGKRILMLYGPPSSGNSQLVILLKPMRLSIRRRAEQCQSRHDRVYRDAQGRRALVIHPPHLDPGEEYQDRAFLADLRR